MTQEEFYAWLINNKFANVNLPEFNPEFLKNYEIAKLVLDKFGISYLSEKKQSKLNLEAVSYWLRVSKNIKLKYDIPEILELLPERIKFSLDLQESQIESLPELKSVGRNLNLWNSQIQTLPKLESIGGSLDLYNFQIQSFPKLESVEGSLYLYNSKIQSLPKLDFVGRNLNLRNSEIQSLPELKSVGGYIYARDKINYWKNYFNNTKRPYLVEKVRKND